MANCSTTMLLRDCPTLGFRSAVLAWCYRDGGTEVLHHNRYFSDAAFNAYSAQYADDDPWIPVACGTARWPAGARHCWRLGPASQVRSRSPPREAVQLPLR